MNRLVHPGIIGRIALLLAAISFSLIPAMGQGTLAAPPSPPLFEDGTVLVGYNAGVTDNAKDSVERGEGVSRIKTLGADTHVVQVGKGQVQAKIAALLRHPEVRYAEPNYVVYTTGTPNDPYYPQLWGLNNTGQTVNGTSGTPGADIRAQPAWAVTTGSANVVVGVVDTGIDYTHPDLAANVWSNPGGIGGCAVGTHGYNAINATCNPMDDNNHGSHVSGTIGAVGNNGIGVVGVNWTTSIMGLKFLNANGSGYISDAITAIDFAVQAKIAGVNVRVLNNSWGGGGFSQALLDEINKAGANGILFVVAAGNSSANNDRTPSYPCSYTTAANLVCVAATDQNDNLAWFSNYGPSSVALGAPGTNILSTIIGGGYAYYQGTSMATPHVTGAAALILSAPGQGTLTVSQLKSAILNAVDPVPSLAGRTITGGRLDVCKAIPGCGTPTPPNAPVLTGTAGNATVHLSWTTPANGGSPITGYNVYRATTAGGETLLATLGTVNSYDDNTAVNGTKYYYQVTAVNAIGESARSNEVSATPTAPTVPGAPVLSATAGNATVHLSWTVPPTGGSAITGYKVYRGTASGGETLLATLGAVTSYNDNAVTNGTRYYYQVTAVNAVGEGARSNEVSATPQAGTPPSAPRNLSATRSEPRGVNLRWSTPASSGSSPITGYRIYRSTSSGTETFLIAAGNVTSYRDTATTRGVRYYYKVTAVNAAGESPMSNEASAVAK